MQDRFAFLFQNPRVKFYAAGVATVVILFLIYAFAIPAPKNFPTGTVLTIEDGTGLLKLSNDLETIHAVRSALWFRMSVISLGGERRLKSGDYSLDHKENVFSLARRIVNAEHNITRVKLTIPEGFTNENISNLFDERFQKFDHKVFLDFARQGYMFPDTYFFEISATATSTIKLLTENLENKIAPLETKISSSGRSLHDVLVLASILEAEVKSEKDMRTVAGILLKRLKLGMPLQVDSAMVTYEKIGLPPEPINNPGLTSVTAALNPIASSYLYFLTDKDSTVHYAKTFSEHNKNIQKYLK
ncbi:MAG: aminodeoxychorismate lyase, protein [Parcubacteria group bacterium]|nr:aminodeoxychorismate lyase, protein [Parcubacteria group bacterium]